MDLSTQYNVELAVLAERSDGTPEDAICEWAYNNERYPTLNAYVRRGITGHRGVAAEAALVAYNARIDRLIAAVKSTPLPTAS